MSKNSAREKESVQGQESCTQKRRGGSMKAARALTDRAERCVLIKQQFKNTGSFTDEKE
jgi:hypothetical protein